MLGRLRRDLTSTFSWAGWLPIIHRAPAGSIALSFDDGPSPETTPRILALLQRHGAKAAFFLLGTRVADHPDLVRILAEAGHGVYAHGFNHVRLDQLPPEQAIEELARTEALLSRVRRTPSPYLVRLPYGSGHRDARIHALLRAWKPDCQIVHWRYDFKDFLLAEGCATQQELAQRCQDAVRRALAHRTFQGSVVLMHENPIGVTGPLVPEIAAMLLHTLLTEVGRRGIGIADVTPQSGLSFLRRHVRTVRME
ncbi:MAG TPA: polysaccharide deacetylase family protein [Roseomonas sp.]|jgi:peptidoglycan/xylan/chitin deacetylase (PgdA/CDA1 family)